MKQMCPALCQRSSVNIAGSLFYRRSDLRRSSGSACWSRICGALRRVSRHANGRKDRVTPGGDLPNVTQEGFRPRGDQWNVTTVSRVLAKAG
jgi:hypothetical protein